MYTHTQKKKGGPIDSLGRGELLITYPPGKEQQEARPALPVPIPRGHGYGVCGEFGWVGLLVVYFPHKINPNSRKNICCGTKGGPNVTFDLIFLGLGF